MNGYGDLSTLDGIFLNFFRFILPLYIAIIIPTFYLKRRKNFVLLFIACSIFFFAFSLFVIYFKIDYQIGWFRFIFLIIFLGSLIMLIGPCDISFKKVICFGMASYAIQNMGDNICSMIYLLSGEPQELWIQWLIYLLSYIFLYSIYYIIFVSKVKNGDLKTMESKAVLTISTFTIMVVYVLSMFGQASEELIGSLVANSYAIASCALLLIIQFNIFHLYNLKHENILLEQILHKENEQLRESKANIELINIKCHDLKHQIAALRNMAKTEQELSAINDLEKEVLIYDETIQTGNVTLDTILTEKFLYCKKHKIIFSAIVDGEKLNFINSIDLYSLFGNAIDNAIDAVKKVKYEKRTITINVKEKNKNLIIHIENHCSEEVEFDKDGYPISRKDKVYHGYGSKSIQYVCKKYGGKAVFKKSGDTFTLNIAIPKEKENTNNV